jgi:hypothetical protein
VNLTGDALREAIDEALAEIDRVEGEMLELFAELLGPDAAVRIAEYGKAQEEQSRLKQLLEKQPSGAD